jgi:hypothetical protein
MGDKAAIGRDDAGDERRSWESGNKKAPELSSRRLDYQKRNGACGVG